MSLALAGRSRTTAIAAVLIVVMFAGSALASASQPAGGYASTGRLLGKTSFAFLGGLRTFTAAVLWNRLEPQFDEYYANKKLSEQVQLLPTMRVVTLLDPQFPQAYYNASFIIAIRGDQAGGLRIAQEGIDNNPKAGILRANIIQILMIQDRKANLSACLEQARIGLQPDMFWQNADDQFEGYATFRTVYDLAGDKEMVAKITAVLEQLKQDGANTAGDQGRKRP